MDKYFIIFTGRYHSLFNIYLGLENLLKEKYYSQLYFRDLAFSLQPAFDVSKETRVIAY